MLKSNAPAPLLAALFALGCGSSESTAQQAPPSGRLDSIVTANLAQDHAVGAVVLLVRGADTLLARGYGKADVDANLAMPRDSIFAIGSITKQFTAAAILKLRDEGRLSLDDDITKWLPDFETQGHRISLRRMLSHTSGIADVTTIPAIRPFVRDAALSRDSMYNVIRRHPLEFVPGSSQSYSNTAFWLLHLIVEKASGVAYQSYVERSLLAPLGMKNSGMCFGNAATLRPVQGHGVRNGMSRRAPENLPNVYMGSGALCSSAADLMTWLRALHGGKVLSEASYSEMIRPVTLNDGRTGKYGLGLEVGQHANGVGFIGHSGELTGYAARANWYPQSKLAVVVLMNNSGDASPSAMAESLSGALIETRPPR